MLTRLLLSFSALMGQLALGVHDPFSQFVISIDGDRAELRGHKSEEGLTLAEIRSFMAERPSYQEFLDYLKQRRPKLFDHFVLLHHSGSLQFASPEKPRTILFGDGLLLAFGEDQHRATRKVELISFDHDSATFSFHELKFGKRSAMKDDPKFCKSCHGSEGRPIWEPYDFWPKAYGSHIARFGTEAERQGYLALAGSAQDSSVISYLNFPEFYYRNYNTVVESFTQYLATMNMVRTMGSLNRKGPFANYIYTAAAILTGCTAGGDGASQAAKLKDYLAPQQASLADGLPDMIAEIRASRNAYKNYLQGQYDSFYGGSPSLFNIRHERLDGEVNPIAQLQLVLQAMGLDIRDHTSSQGDNPYFFSVPSNFQQDLAAALFTVDFDGLEEARTGVMNGAFGWPRFSCSTLRELAQSKQPLLPMTPRQEPFKAPSIMGTCLGCHTLGKTAPYIPFDDSSRLRTWLKEGGLGKVTDRLKRHGPGQMPPSKQWTTEDRKELLRVFRKLSK